MTDFIHGVGTGVWIGLLILNVVRQKKDAKNEQRGDDRRGGGE